MDRPTREQVEGAMDLDSLKYEAVLDAYNVLRAEVLALRAELEAANCETAELERKLDEWVTANVNLRATIMRVEALMDPDHDGARLRAGDVRAALKGS